MTLNRGDIVEIQWVIDSLRPEGDKELLWFREYVIEITKIKDGKKETLPAEEIETEETTNKKAFSQESGILQENTVRPVY